jgi:tellurite resistance protein
MPELLSNLSQICRAQLQRHRNRSFLRATMAACALVAMASGAVSFRQRVRIDRVMETLDALNVFDPHEGVDLFNEFAGMLGTDQEAGRIRVLDVVAREVSQHPEKARLLARICLAVSEQEGAVPQAEQREIAALCGYVGLDPGDCGLSAIGIRLSADLER